ncbi:FMN-dependent NADH-azoreductase [Hazenella sp. IB182357]|uniref:FMN dependent NADH:quinone oxidoreductase n=1 Tax=Polycladospora coralii TaxID=2771432 RepID=A0A926N7W1_9BACL|nr:FMN-dependent NADH-azoreductase [Polycladospora coralii]MBD1371706.1 FMN-dependent NADH-azoreductase [Polycladospora coralii]MBS7529173.1 FMN-dependent NADH-azoreductase [Polycladospora coralii]
MANVLYITANPKPEEESVSLQMGKAFIEAYELANPMDHIIHLDLYKEYIPFLDEDVFNGWNHAFLGLPTTDDERKKLKRINELVDQFVDADKYVFVTPMWNFGSPPVVKAYFDCVCMAGKTYQVLGNETVGLLLHKQAVHIQARGGFYGQNGEQAKEFGDRYIRLILGFMGVSDVHSIIAEGTSDPYRSKKMMIEAVQQAKAYAPVFASSMMYEQQCE